MDMTDLIFGISIAMVVVIALSAAGVFGKRKR